jgi:lipoprotein-releasing system permease protein
MYHALLTNRYLTSHVIPLIAVAAVALCVTLVIVVVSVMTGFLNMVKNSGRSLMGDVVVTYPVTGIPHYEALIERITALPEADAAAPVIESWGLLRMPYPMGPNKQTETVQVWGVDERFADVTGYADSLYWKPYPQDELATMGADDIRKIINTPIVQGEPTVAEQMLKDALALHHTPSGRPGIVPGIHVSIGNERQKDGSYRQMGAGTWWLPYYDVTLTVLPISSAGSMLEPESVVFPVVNEFVSGVYLIDDKRVIIPLKDAQEMLHFDEGLLTDSEQLDEDGLPKVIGPDPARTTMILVRARDGVTPDALRDLVEAQYIQLAEEMFQDTSVQVPPPSLERVMIVTWEKLQAEFIGPIEKERELMRVLFSLIYIVCAGLVLAIFWSIVYDKTRDIGILRSVGATRSGILWIFLRYGLIIGVLGSAGGLGLAYLVVRNINAIHNAMGEAAPPAVWGTVFGLAALSAVIALIVAYSGRLLPMALWSLLAAALFAAGVGLYFHKGTLIWDPSVYYFSRIPNEIDPDTAIITMIGAVFFSLLGAFIPAARAADVDPVRALRYE